MYTCKRKFLKGDTALSMTVLLYRQLGGKDREDV